MADTTNNEEIMETNSDAAEVKEAQKTGVIDMSSKKDEEKNTQKSLNYTHKFREPVEMDGKKYETITFYFENLTGEDVEKIEEELQDQNKYVLSPEVSSQFQSMLAARAAGVSSDAIRELPMGDYMKIKNKARGFLLETGY